MTIRTLQYEIQTLIDEKGVPDDAVVIARGDHLFAEWYDKAEDGTEKHNSVKIGGYVPTKGNKADLSDMQKEWFANLLDEEINQELGAAQNENLWALGADDEETSSMHGMNGLEHRGYATFLEGLKETYIGTN